MKKFNYLFAVIFSVVLILVGCQMGNNKDNRPSENTNFENTRYNDKTGTVNNRDRGRGTDDGDFTSRVRNSNERSGNLNRSTNNTQSRYDVSKEAADRIVDEIAEIDSAYVLTSRKNAYVAAKLNNSSTGENRTATRGKTNSSVDHVRNPNEQSVTDRTVNDREEGRRKEGDRTTTRRGKMDNNNNRDNVNNNMTTNRGQNNNDMTNRRGNDNFNDDLTADIENEIADIVQSVDNNIDNVYVSTSPDFFDLADNYVDDMDNGRPIRGFFDQIGNTIERIFPQNRQ